MPKVLSLLHKFVGTFCLIVCLSFLPSAGSAFPCGDCNGDSTSGNVLDATYLMNYFFHGGPPPPDMLAADFDRYAGVTPLEISYIWERIGCGGQPPSCPPTFPAKQVVPDSAYRISHTRWVEPGVSNATVTMEFFNEESIYLLYLPLEIRVGGDVPQIDSVILDYEPFSIFATGGYLVDTVNGRALIWFHSVACGLLAGNSKVEILLNLFINESTERRLISLNWTKFSPLQASPPDSSLVPMAGSALGLFEPIISCCADRRGNLNGDGGNANVIDLTFAVDYIFRSSGNRGDCVYESDVNADGSVLNILDLTALVDFIFRGGPQPADCF